MVGDVRFAGEGDGDDLDRLVVVERSKDEAVQRLDVDRLGRSGGRISRVGQTDSSLGTSGAPSASTHEAAVPIGIERADAVAEVGRAAGEGSTSAGALHSVQSSCLAAGRTKRRSQPIARAARASSS